MPLDRSRIEQNNRQRERLRTLVTRIGEDELRIPVNPEWTVAGVLGHMAFWDSRALVLAEKVERGVSFTPADAEPENVDLINDSTRPLIHAIAPRATAALALRLAEEVDRRVANLSTAALWPDDPNSPLNPLRASHRGEHLDQIEAALVAAGARSGR
jgi:hypothetical protein